MEPEDVTGLLQSHDQKEWNVPSYDELSSQMESNASEEKGNIVEVTTKGLGHGLQLIDKTTAGFERAGSNCVKGFILVVKCYQQRSTP